MDKVSDGSTGLPAPVSDLCEGKPPAIKVGTASISVLSVSAFWDDPDTVEQILHPPQWTILKARTLKSAIAVLQSHRLPLVLCEQNLDQDTWRDLLVQVALIPSPPFLIVTSRLADEYLWAEALNLGAYDVLARPFDATELTRTLSSAWLRWCDRHCAGRTSHIVVSG